MAENYFTENAAFSLSADAGAGSVDVLLQENHLVSGADDMYGRVTRVTRSYTQFINGITNRLPLMSMGDVVNVLNAMGAELCDALKSGNIAPKIHNSVTLLVSSVHKRHQGDASFCAFLRSKKCEHCEQTKTRKQASLEAC